MAMSLGGGAREADVMVDINTTPLIDVMLVLLIIFLITIPVVVQNVTLDLPRERNVPTQTKPENIVIAVDRDGNAYWNNQPVEDAQLFTRLKEIAVRQPQPEVHIRGDEKARYESIGRVVFACQRAAISKISFVTEPPAKG